MNTGKIKSDLIAAIQSADDPLVLLELSKLMDISLPDNRMIKLSDRQKSQLQEAISQMDNGQAISHRAANEQSEEWLKE